MFANISFQRVCKISASTYADLESAPFFIRFESIENDRGPDRYSVGEICLHLEDVVLANALVVAINDAVAKHKARLAELAS